MEEEDVIEIILIKGEIDVEGNLSSNARMGLVINGEEIDWSDAYIQRPFRNQKRHSLSVRSEILAERLLRCKLTSFPDNLSSMTFELPAKEYKGKVESEEPKFGAITFKETGETVFTFTSAINVFEWTFPVTFNDYLEMLRTRGFIRYLDFIVDYGESGDRDDALYKTGALEVYMRFPYRNTDKRAIEVMEELKEICYLIYYENIVSLSEKDKHSVEIALDLPPDVRVACEQYLLYFVQFLKDLGVEASSELKHDAERVLFSVTPADKDEALDKIRTALEVYLCLPSGKLAVAGDEPVEVQRLSANIFHLQGQLMLAQATIQHKDAAIQLQQATIQHQQLLLAQNVITQSVVDITPKPDDKEEFLGGAFALTKYQDKGIVINFAEIFRKLRRLFQK